MKTGLSYEFLSSYPFIGSPDIIIKNRVVYYDGDDEETTSADELLEVKNQTDPQGSPYPKKLGELIAGLHLVLILGHHIFVKYPCSFIARKAQFYLL